ncbi:MAG: serine/threonine protein kinase [Acidobacteria bacterium]|nr:serine/threonine protein kinase [Acidobacteriota bacterium]
MSDLVPGDRLGPYEVLSVVGRGGMGIVYKGYDRTLDRHVALKVLHAHFLAEPSFADRFRREAQIWGRLDHAAIVPVYFADIQEERPFLAMKFVPGGSVLDVLKKGRLPLPQAAAILLDAAAALDHAHALGIVHRDVKPANVLLGEGGRAYLSDFGIARVVATTPGTAQTTGVVGTPGYMAPEQARSHEPDTRVDIYSLGCMAYEMLTGEPPFRGTTPVEVMMRHIHDTPTPPRAFVPALPPKVEEAILRAMAKEPQERWPSAGTFIQALLGAVDAEAVRTISLHRHPSLPTPPVPVTRPAAPGAASPIGRLLTAAALGLLLGGGLFLWIRTLLPGPPLRSSETDRASLDALVAGVRRAMDEGAYPDALRMADLAARLAAPGDVESRRLRERIRRAWEAEQNLGLWAPPPSPAPTSPSVDDRAPTR